MSGKGRRESKSQGSRGPECEDHCGTDEATIKKNTIVVDSVSAKSRSMDIGMSKHQSRVRGRHDHKPRRRSVAPTIPSYIHSKSEKCQGRERDAYPASFQSSHATRSRGCMRVASKEFRLVVNKDGRGGVARGQRQRGDPEMVVIGTYGPDLNTSEHTCPDGILTGLQLGSRSWKTLE
ncbi:hypothetical protein B0H13DRAFT_1905594 [Mycena leptocephala]|nr:hypothetical protein B0H13DRAFT_1905594 [Mycena leptocephala]